MGGNLFEARSPLSGTSRVPYLLRAGDHALRMRQMGGEEWHGCSCPSVRDEDGNGIGVLTVCPPGQAGPCAGCTTSRDDVGFPGETALSRELLRLSDEGWSVVDLKDDTGEFRVRLDLPKIVRALRFEGMPTSVSAQALASPVMSRIARCGIALVAAPLVLATGAVAMVHVLGLFAPLALVMAPFIVMFLPVIIVGLCADGKLAAEGTVTAIALDAQEHPGTKHEEQLDEMLVPLQLAPDFAWEPVKMRVRVSSFPGAMPTVSGVFAREIGTSRDDEFESAEGDLATRAEHEPPAIVA